jgi:KilA-N domain
VLEIVSHAVRVRIAPLCLSQRLNDKSCFLIVILAKKCRKIRYSRYHGTTHLFASTPLKFIILGHVQWNPCIRNVCHPASSNPAYPILMCIRMCKGIAVMRRRSDSWLNATQILKVAGFDKPQRTRILEREVQKGEHEKVQGGYGKYQGLYMLLCQANQYSLEQT